MARKNPNSPVFTETIVLTEEQEQAIVDLKAERERFIEQLKTARRKKSKIKDIFDNFEAVILGDVLLDILPDENADEIVNSVIISKTDIINVLNGFDTTEITEVTTTGAFNDITTETVGTVSGYTEEQVSSAKQILDKIFKRTAVKELIRLSPILNEGELYVPVYLQKINDASGDTDGKELLRDIIEDIETTTLEP